MALADDVPQAWRATLAGELTQPYFAELAAFVDAERKAHAVFPAPELTFAALARTPPEHVRVVLLGQDPYPTKGNANGLAFSVNAGQRIPASLKNIFTLLATDVGATPAPHGDLGQWADQGVLLLNTVLTVREKEPASHAKKGWETFTKAILTALAAGPRPLVFLLLGAHAQKLGAMVDPQRHALVTAAHPSPMSVEKFFQSRPFSAVNAALAAQGRGAIDWQIR